LHRAVYRLFEPLVAHNSRIDQVAEVVLEEARALTTSRHGFVSTIDARTGDNVCHTLTSMLGRECRMMEQDRRVVFPPRPDGTYPGLWGSAINRREAFFTNTPKEHPAKQGVPKGHVPIERFLAVPVMLGEEPVGEIALANPARDYTEADLAAVKVLGGCFALAVQRLRFQDALRSERDAWQASEAMFRALFEQAAVGVAQVETGTGRFIKVNRKFCDILGYSPEEIRERTFMQVTHPDDLAADMENLQRMAAGELREYSLEKRYFHKQGSIVWVHLSVSPLWETGQAPTHHVAVVQDITSRKEVEAQLTRVMGRLEREVLRRTLKLRRSNKQLRSEILVRQDAERRIKEAEVRYRTVADFTHDWEYWRAPDQSLLYCSPSCLRVTGWTAEEFLSNPALLDDIVVPDDRPAWDLHTHEATAQLGERSLQFRIRRKNGQIAWIEHVCKSVTGPEGEFLGIRAGNRDISSRRLAELETQRLRAELNRAARVTMAGQLTAAIAHELNQPLGAILCNAQSAETLLSVDPADVAEARGALSDIRDDARRAGAVIRHLRTLYEQTGKTRSVVNLEEIIRETVELLRSEFVLRQVELQLDIRAMGPVFGNATELQQVVMNLVLNAIDAMNSSAPGARHLSVATKQEAGQAWCSITDSGPGIPAEALDRVFEPFFTTKPAGMGMGLAICHSIIEAHDGELWAGNNPGGGAVFHFRLPQRKGNQA
jgi:PAS domain S-box-containing protein